MSALLYWIQFAQQPPHSTFYNMVRLPISAHQGWARDPDLGHTLHHLRNNDRSKG